MTFEDLNSFWMKQNISVKWNHLGGLRGVKVDNFLSAFMHSTLIGVFFFFSFLDTVMLFDFATPLAWQNCLFSHLSCIVDFQDQTSR